MKNKIYLAGGIKTNWQESVISEITDCEFYNPRDKEVNKILTLDEYGTWDLYHIKKSDIVFAYMEKTNPSGIGLAVEIGYAKGLGKTVILCLEENNEKINDRYLDFLKLTSDIVFTDLDSAITYLKLY